MKIFHYPHENFSLPPLQRIISICLDTPCIFQRFCYNKDNREGRKKGNTMNAETIFNPLNLEAKYNVMQMIISEAIQTAEMCVNEYNNWGFKSHINPDRATASLAELFQNEGLTVDKEELAATVNKFLEWFKWELEGYESKPTLGETLLKYDLYGMVCELLEPIMEDIADAIDPELLEQDYDRIDYMLGKQINLCIIPQARLLPNNPF